MTPEQSYVMQTIKSRGVRFVRLWFTDVMGTMKSFAVSPNEMAHAFEEGMGFDGSCIRGFTGAEVSDVLAFPDASTFQILPWRPGLNAVARMFCSIRTPEGEPFIGDSRHVLATVMEKATKMGYEPNMGPELEYFYFKDHTAPVPLDNGGYFDLMSLDSAVDLRRDTVLALEQMGIPVEYSHHEAGPSQNEIDLRYSDAMSMADAVMTYKLVVKEIGANHGVYASFMPKPLSSKPGNGMHVHMSLFNEEGENAFFDKNDPMGYNLSKTAKHFIAGLLKYAPEFCLLTNQFVNSYNRLFSSSATSYSLTWGHRNRSTLVRVPGYRPGRAQECRVQLRNPDPACNPYLAFAAMITAGLKGVEDELPLCEPVDGFNLSKMSFEDLKNAGFKLMPRSLGEAIELFAESELMKELLGTHIHEFLVQEKRKEWNEFLGQVSQWEIDRYFERL